MRDLKFRAWDKINKVMIHFGRDWICEEYSAICWSPIEEEYDGIGNLPGSYNNLEDGNPINKQYELMEWTGIKYKNAIEVYEGDILLDKKIKWEVFFSNETYAWTLRAKHAYGNTTNHRIYRKLQWIIKRDFEIIGNIYVNHDLLN